MDIGMIGLGRMGTNLAQRLIEDGHRVVAYDIDPDAVTRVEAKGAVGVGDLASLSASLPVPRAVWVMVPAAITGRVIRELSGHLEPGDVVIDGGNSFYQHDLHRAGQLSELGIRLVDVGTSGGVFGLERGFSLMIGGDPEVVQMLDPVFRSLAPGVETAERTEGRAGAPSPGEHGYLHCGPTGAGHFAKMVHNGIEYGVMAAYAEGLNILHHAGIGRHGAEEDAEATPLRVPSHYRYDFDLAAVAEVWRRGSVISSWLLDLTAAALVDSPELSEFSGKVSDSGEGRWTLLSAVEEGVPAPVLSAALFSRFDSRGRDEFANRVLSAMRHRFGGHEEGRDDG